MRAIGTAEECDVARVECEVESCDLMGSNQKMIPSVRLTCTECGHKEQAFGEGEASIKRCLALMREHCPEDQDNFYVSDDDE
jgi:hypothetical protein